ncbi:PKS-NRPS hybrid synthetase [Metarhizium anisopliae]|nr:PKS-NRPS hybrid synthetase [Metarhizium anisopliae]
MAAPQHYPSFGAVWLVDPNHVLLMDPPPEASFSSREALLSSVRQFARSQGYVVTIRRSTANKNVVLGCDRGGEYHDRIDTPDGSKRRKTSSRRIGCPFELYGACRRDGTWDLKVRNREHTHDPDDLVAHPLARQFLPEQRAAIARLSGLNVKPQAIESILRDENPEALFTRRDIYNVRLAERVKQLGGKTAVEYLVGRLRNEDNWLHKLQCDSDGQFEFFLFPHKKSIEQRPRAPVDNT